MTLNIEVVRVQAQTAGGSQNVTVPGFGTTKAAMFFANRALVDDSSTSSSNDHCVMSIGLTEGTTRRTISTLSEQGVTVSDTYRVGYVDEVVGYLTPAGGLDGEANVLFITDGVRLDWGIAPSSAWYIIVVMFGGDDVANVACGGFDTSSTQDASVNVDVGFKPNLVFAVSNDQIFGLSQASQMRGSWGIAIDDGGVVQRTYNLASRDGQANASVSEFFGEDRWVTDIELDAHRASAELTAFITSPVNGFTVTTRDFAEALTIGYLAFEITNHALDLRTIDIPSSTGLSTHNVGVDPAFVLHTATTAESTGFRTGSDHAGSYSIGATTEVATQFVNGCYDSHGQSTMRARSLSNPEMAFVTQLSPGFENAKASLDSFTSNGFVLDWSEVFTDTPVRKGFALTIGEEAAAAGDGNWWLYNRHRRKQGAR